MRNASTVPSACAGALLALALALAFALLPSPVDAFPRRVRDAARREASSATTTARRTPALPPGPPVALQLTGLRLGAPISAAALTHALARDAWPRLSRCTAPANRRGYTNVELRQLGPRRALQVVVRNGPAGRDPALARCIEQSLAGLAVPPYDGPTPEVTASFDLVFNFPALQPARRR